jgi:hypothetical protein
MEILIGMTKELSEDSQACSDALYTANQVINAVHWDNPSYNIKISNLKGQ